MAETGSPTKLNESLTKFYARRTDYVHVTVLVLFWQDCSIKGFQEEAYEIGSLFNKDFGYNVEYFEIPSLESQFALDIRLNEVLSTNKRDRNLLIIHYGGHGDEDYAESVRQSVCESTGIASLRWSDLQPKLSYHASEVLLLLDCCYASQAARDSKSPIPPNVELLAACGMNTKTVLPGPQSFTSVLIKEIRDTLNSPGFVKVSEIHKNMASRHSSLTESAIYFPLGSARASITLRPLVSLDDRKEPPKEVGSLTIRLSLVKLEANALDEIIEWLKLNPPHAVSNVVIEQLRNTANAVNSYINDNPGRGHNLTSYHNLPEVARDDVNTAWTYFNGTVKKIASYLRVEREEPTAHRRREDDFPTSYVKELTHSFEPVREALEQSIMTLPALSKEEDLLAAVSDQQLVNIGLTEMLKLRVMAHFGSQSTIDMEISLSAAQLTDPFPKRTIESMPNVGRVLIEAKKIDEYADPQTFKISKSRLENLAALLQSSKSSDFHTLVCQGFFFEPKKAYGLVFQLPPGSRNLPITLRDIIGKKVRVLRKPTLGERFQVAHKIGVAVLKWHLVNWVHQGIASHNIVFFYDEQNGVDYANPYLCGFEYSRKRTAPSLSRIVEEFDLNVYRHPDRQGAPSESHTKEHDLYSYGILLLEIGIWDLVQSLFNPKERSSISPVDMSKKICDIARKELAHYAGAAFQKAACICLNGEFGIERDDKMDSHLAKEFATRVLSEIEKITVVK